jgi:hypothetical protein
MMKSVSRRTRGLILALFATAALTAAALLAVNGDQFRGVPLNAAVNVHKG